MQEVHAEDRASRIGICVNVTELLAYTIMGIAGPVGLALGPEENKLAYWVMTIPYTFIAACIFKRLLCGEETLNDMIHRPPQAVM